MSCYVSLSYCRPLERQTSIGGPLSHDLRLPRDKGPIENMSPQYQQGVDSTRASFPDGEVGPSTLIKDPPPSDPPGKALCPKVKTDEYMLSHLQTPRATEERFEEYLGIKVRPTPSEVNRQTVPKEVAGSLGMEPPEDPTEQTLLKGSFEKPTKDDKEQ